LAEDGFRPVGVLQVINQRCFHARYAACNQRLEQDAKATF
jgi:hypothetical protein